VYLGIDLCGLDGAVAEKRPNLLERCSVPQHGGCHGMAEHMGRPSTRAHDPCLAHRLSNDGRYRRMGSEGAKRRASAEEHDIGIEVRTAFLEVVHDGIADLLGQRQACLTTSLATYTDCGFSPVDIPETEMDDISRPKPQASEEKQNRSISSADGCGRITGSDDSFDVFREDVPRKRGKPPEGQGGNGCIQAGGAVPFTDEKAKEHAESRGTPLCYPPSRLSACLQNKPPQALCIEPAWIVSETSQQRLNTETVIVKGLITGSAHLSHPLPKGDEQRRILPLFKRGGHRTGAAQILQKQPVAFEQVQWDRTKTWASATLQVLMETFKKVFCQIWDGYAFPLRPMKQVLRASDALLGGYPYIARPAQFFRKPLKQRALRPSAECLNSFMAPEKMF